MEEQNKNEYKCNQCHKNEGFEVVVEHDYVTAIEGKNEEGEKTLIVETTGNGQMLQGAYLQCGACGVNQKTSEGYYKSFEYKSEY